MAESFRATPSAPISQAKWRSSVAVGEPQIAETLRDHAARMLTDQYDLRSAAWIEYDHRIALAPQELAVHSHPVASDCDSPCCSDSFRIAIRCQIHYSRYKQGGRMKPQSRDTIAERIRLHGKQLTAAEHKLVDALLAELSGRRSFEHHRTRSRGQASARRPYCALQRS